jgi:PAS domain S-box-containing protein
MSTRNSISDLQFLAGGGEMGELMRKKDWGKTPVGKPSDWPQSLRTTLSIILNSKFPMFLWWGKALTCFYNDAYRPSLGSNGKHPSILGEAAETAWTEIWTIIKPLIDQVLAGGEATWSEDQLIPIFRNGRIEDVYWTFSYSPVNDESNSVAGVLVTCNETTEKVNSLQNIAEREEQLNFTIDAAELGTWDLDPTTGRFTGNDRLREWFGISAGNEIELANAVSAIHEKDRQRVNDAILAAIQPGSDGNYYIEYTIVNLHTGKERRILAKGKAAFSDEGPAKRFSGTLQDITEQYIARKKTEASEKEFRQLADSLPTLVWTTDAAGKQTFASRRWKEFTGLDPYGSETFEAIVHPDDLAAIAARWMESLATGNIYTTQVRLRRHDGSYHWFLVNGEPLKNEKGKIEKWVGTFATINDQKITEENLTSALHRVEESDKRFRDTVKQAPLGITILRGKRFLPEMANETYLQLVDKNEKDFVGKPLFDSLPEVQAVVEPLLNNVMETGIAFHAAELAATLNRHGKTELAYFNLVYHPLKEENGEISGIMVVAAEVTDSVRAKHTLLESEKQFRNLVMQSPIPMTIFSGPNYIVELANRIMFENIWRKKESEVLGKPLLDVFPELKEQKYVDLLAEVYTTGKSHTEKEAIAFVQGNDGLKKFYLDFEYSPMFDTENTVTGLIVTVNDVTERVDARLKIEENEKRLSIVIDSSELGTWDWNLVTDEMAYSKRHLEIFNYTDEESMHHHRNHLANLHPDDIAIRDKAVKEALKKGHLSYESRIIWADGSVHWIEIMGKVFYDDDRKPLKLIGTVRDITNEKRRQQELQENEQRFRLLADSMPQHIWTADPAGNLNYYNKSVFDYSGLTLEEITEKGWLAIVHPDDRESNIKEWALAITTGNDFLFEHRFRRHDGEYRWQLSRALPQKDAEGNIQMWVGTSTDIEDQKMFTSELERQVNQRTNELMQLNETLAQSEQRYHLMVEEVQDYAILYLNREGIVENWNKGAEKIKGYLAEEIIGKSFSIFYPEHERQNKLPEQLLQEAVNKGKVIHEGFRVRKNSSLFWASVAITAVHDQDGNVIGFSKVTHDLTEKKVADDRIKQNAKQLEQKNETLQQLNETLAQSEQRYHLMVEEVEDYAILYLNREGIVENWNKGAEKIKGYKAEEIIGKSFSLFYPEQDRKNSLPEYLLEQAMEKGKVIHEGYRLRKNGSLFWASVAITAVHDEKDNVIGFSKVTHDLTEKKAADDKIRENAEQLAQKNKDLEKMNVELQSFAYVSSHDLQEPLRKIQTFASRILSKEAATLSDNGKDYFKRIQESAGRMQTLIQDLLAYSRTSTTDRAFEKADLGKIAEEVKLDIKETNPEKDAVIEINSLCEAHVIPFQFRQLLYNLVNNAIKFAKPGIPPHITISSETVKGAEVKTENLDPKISYCHISVADNGIGFDPQYSKRIFEVFQRLHGKEEYSGTGIGLAIVKKIVDNHNGAISATGKIGGGARFDIYLPL